MKLEDITFDTGMAHDAYNGVYSSMSLASFIAIVNESDPWKPPSSLI